mgnify:CR=1 FL=1|tara:strand:- start:1676 stop:2173 length:498 start_codon:yes stop_codon:yes gene_type:complete
MNFQTVNKTTEFDNVDQTPTKFKDLSSVEQTMVKCLRIQTIGQIQPEKSQSVLSGPKDQAVKAYFQPIGSIARCMLVGSTEPIDVHNVKCPCFGQAEKLFLRLLYLQQQKKFEQVNIECHEKFYPTTARIISKNLNALALILDNFGAEIPNRSCYTQQTRPLLIN